MTHRQMSGRAIGWAALGAGLLGAVLLHSPGTDAGENTGVPMAAAMCMGPVSPPKYRSAR